MPSSSYTKTASPFRPGIRPEAEFSGNENSFFLHAAWLGSYCTVSSPLHQLLRVSADFIGTQRGISRKD
jgi:hypothetical protein